MLFDRTNEISKRIKYVLYEWILVIAFALVLFIEYIISCWFSTFFSGEIVLSNTIFPLIFEKKKNILKPTVLPSLRFKKTK